MTPRAPEAGLLVTPQVRLVRRLGAGGMGTVWVARHEALGIDVAVKLLHAATAASPRALRRFEREAALLAKVRSPHVVAVLDAGSSELGPYLVMELLEGRDLGVVLDERGRLPLAEVLVIAEHVCAGLAKAHGAGLVHRDLKPANLFACGGDAPLVKILDFGVALARDEESALTEAGATIGTRSTMSPEQAAGRSVDARSDLYSLALVLFQLLTGAPAISRASLDALGLAAYEMDRPRPSSLAPGTPPGVDAWFARATAPLPEDRYPDAAALLDALRAAASGEAPGAREALVETTDGGEPFAPDETAEATADGARGPSDTPAPEAPAERERTRAHGSDDAPASPPPPARARGSAARAAGLLGVALALGAAALGLSRGAGVKGPPDAASLASASAPSAARDATEVHLALLTDLSGDNRRRGAELERAARAAVLALNEAGGVRGRRLTLDAVDEQGASGPFLLARAEEAARRASVPAVLGPLLSAQALEVRSALAARGLLAVSATATADALSTDAAGGPDGFVGLSPADSEQAGALGQLAKRRGSGGAGACTRLAIVATRDSHGEPFARALEAEARRPPLLEVTTTLVEREPRRRYDELAAALARAKADCVALVVSPKLGGRILASIPTDERRRLRVLAGDSLASQDFVEFGRGDVGDVTAPSLAEGTEGIAVASAPADRAELAAFRRLFRASSGRDPEEPFAPHQFDAVVLLALALEAEGLDAPAPRLRDAMVRVSGGKSGHGPAELDRLLRAVARGEDAGYEGASGDVHLLPSGRVRGAFDAWRVRGGKIVRLGPAR